VRWCYIPTNKPRDVAGPREPTGHSKGNYPYWRAAFYLPCCTALVTVSYNKATD
jgi:hypothetical protein